MENNVIPCLTCGTLMNHHADKLLYVHDGAGNKAGVGELLEEFHRCLHCGAGVSRRANLPGGRYS